MTTTARSWKIRNETATSPTGELVSRRPESNFNTMAVELNDTRHPVKTALRASTPNAMHPPATRPAVSRTWVAPPPNSSEPSDRSRSTLSSSPMPNSRKITPISAVCSMRSVSVTRPSACGPTRAPATTNPTMGTSPMRVHR
jgi:hypothetical protein